MKNLNSCEIIGEAAFQSIKTALEDKRQEKCDLEYRIVKADGEIAAIADRVISLEIVLSRPLE